MRQLLVRATDRAPTAPPSRTRRDRPSRPDAAAGVAHAIRSSTRVEHAALSKHPPQILGGRMRVDIVDAGERCVSNVADHLKLHAVAERQASRTCGGTDVR